MMDFVRKNIAAEIRGRRSPHRASAPRWACRAAAWAMPTFPVHDRRTRHAEAGAIRQARSWPTCARCRAWSMWTRHSRRASRSTASRSTARRRPDLGVSIADIGNTLRLLVAGDKVSDYNEKGEQYEVHIRAAADFRNRLDELTMVTVPSIEVGTVPLGDVVRFEEGTGPAAIDRLSRTRQVTINANIAPGTSQQDLLRPIDEAAAKLNMGPDYTTGLLGRSKEMARMFCGFFLAFVVAFIFVYLVIAAQFESWLHPITILLSLPLTLPFALLSLLLFSQSLNMFSLLGILVLFAVVKKNSILQIDHTNQLREAGMPRFDAIVAANRDRLRPILMTTVAFVAGMVPAVGVKRRGRRHQQDHQRRDRRRPDALAAADAARHARGLLALRRPGQFAALPPPAPERPAVSTASRRQRRISPPPFRAIPKRCRPRSGSSDPAVILRSPSRQRHSPPALCEAPRRRWRECCRSFGCRRRWRACRCCGRLRS